MTEDQIDLPAQNEAVDPGAASNPSGTTGPQELTRDLATVARSLVEPQTVQEVLDQIVQLSTELIEACDGAGILLLMGDEVLTPATTSEAVDAIDTLQARTREGPCVDAIRQEEVFSSPDILADGRWPNFAAAAAEAGFRSALSFRLFVDEESLGALNLYSGVLDAFSPDDRLKGAVIAAQAAATMARTATSTQVASEAERLRDALESRDVIGQAKGILMERNKITDDEAFDMLRRSSQHLNVKLREVARRLVESGEDPDAGDP